MNYLKDVNYVLNVPAHVPIIIDYGASTTKAGYTTSTDPDLIMRTYINKFKDSLTQSNQIATWDTDIFKNYRSPFDRNLIQHSGALENINDFIFERLCAGRNDRIEHPLILTECFATTDYSRMIVLEQMFECYRVPSVMLGVDTLFSAYDNSLDKYLKQTRLVINFGDQTTHIAPIVNGQIIYQNIKRLNVGGLQSLKYFYQTMQLRHPHLKLTYGQLDSWHKNHTAIAMDYKEQLLHFKGLRSNDIYYGYRDQISEDNRLIQEDIPFIEPLYIDIPIVQKIVSAEDLKKKEEIRYKMRVRLQESIQQSKLKKQGLLEEQLKQLEEQYNQSPNDDLNKKIKTIQVKLGLIPKESLEEFKYSLLQTPDDQLTPQQLNQKRCQRIMYEQAQQRRAKNQEFKQKQEEAKKFKIEEPEKYLDMLYEKRERLQQQINERKKLYQEMNNRNSRFNQKRIQTLAYLGQEEKIEDDFGKDDKDWEIYRSINKELDSEDEKNKYKLSEIENELKEIDPEFDTKILKSIANVHELGMNLSSIMMSVDRVRCQEIYFQPSIVGNEQQGIVDAIKLSVRGLDQSLLQNIYLTGGASQIPNLRNRLIRDLQSEFDTDIDIQVTENGVLGAWYGMKSFSEKYPQMVNQFSISYEEYQEGGMNEIFKQHPFSNIIE